VGAAFREGRVSVCVYALFDVDGLVWFGHSLVMTGAGEVASDRKVEILASLRGVHGHIRVEDLQPGTLLMCWGVVLFFLFAGVIMWYDKKGKEQDVKVGPSAMFYLMVPTAIIAIAVVFTVQYLWVNP